MDYNDYELVYLVRENDESATEILLKKYDNIIWSICYSCYRRYFNYSIDIDVEDLVQEARITLYYAFRNYNPDSDFLVYSFVVLVVKRRVVSLLNTKYRKKFINVSIDKDDSYLQIADGFYNTPDFLISEKELEDMIAGFKNTLDFEEAAIFDLRYSSFSYGDISNILGISTKLIDNKLVKIRNKLKKYLLKF